MSDRKGVTVHLAGSVGSMRNFPTATAVRIVSEGHLEVVNKAGDRIALFAPGNWRNAEVEQGQ